MLKVSILAIFFLISIAYVDLQEITSILPPSDDEKGFVENAKDKISNAAEAISNSASSLFTKIGFQNDEAGLKEKAIEAESTMYMPPTSAFSGRFGAEGMAMELDSKKSTMAAKRDKGSSSSSSEETTATGKLRPAYYGKLWKRLNLKSSEESTGIRSVMASVRNTKTQTVEPEVDENIDQLKSRKTGKDKMKKSAGSSESSEEPMSNTTPEDAKVNDDDLMDRFTMGERSRKLVKRGYIRNIESDERSGEVRAEKAG